MLSSNHGVPWNFVCVWEFGFGYGDYRGDIVWFQISFLIKKTV